MHALEEIRRVLVPDGILIDLRPLADNWRVEVVSLREVKRTGRVEDLPVQTDGDISANDAMREVEKRGWFKRKQDELFPFFYSWDTPSEMEDLIADDWSDFIGLSEELKKATRSTWAIGDADSRVRVRMKVFITKWRAAAQSVRGASQS